ncbi:hypothetical protein AKJ16_DCAP08138 [Drosera capensis]
MKSAVVDSSGHELNRNRFNSSNEESITPSKEVTEMSLINGVLPNVIVFIPSEAGVFTWSMKTTRRGFRCRSCVVESGAWRNRTALILSSARGETE